MKDKDFQKYHSLDVNPKVDLDIEGLLKQKGELNFGRDDSELDELDDPKLLEKSGLRDLDSTSMINDIQ